MNKTNIDNSVPDSPVFGRLRERFGETIIEHHAAFGDETVIVDPGRLVEVIGFLKDEPGLEFDLLMDLCGVDYLPRRPRFEVVYHLFSVKHRFRQRVKVQLAEPDPEVGSITELYRVANWFEREVWDMFGIKFTGHPDLRRILMYEEFEGHPLRRDYPIDKRQPIAPALTEHL